VNLDALYREVVLDHHRHPRGREPLERVDAHSHGVNPSCGDDVTIELAVDGGRVTGVSVRGHGCAISTASGSILAELLDAGVSVDHARRLVTTLRGLMRGEPLPEETDLGDLEALAGVRRFPVRVKCALLPWITLELALDGGDDRP
jgi:nitrogen fixation protein NifU and related proteins